MVSFRVMVFEQGELKEHGRPKELLKDLGSMFADMAKHAPGLKSVVTGNSDEECATSSGVGASSEDCVDIGPNGFE